jgi:undecaprenyl-diphosphatase
VRPAEAVVLGIIQGATEFLPVSSSGHLVLASKILGVTEPGVRVAASLHVGTLAAVTWFTRRELTQLLRGVATDRRSRQLLAALVLGSLPVAVAGVAVLPVADTLFSSSLWVGLGLLGTCAVLWHSRWPVPERKSTPSGRDALLIGAAQAVALVPGVSRSGATIWAGMRRGLDRVQAARFSFLLCIPATIGAATVEILRPSRGDGAGLATLALGSAVAAITGVVALRVLLRLVIVGRLWVFAPYCLVAAVAATVLSFV